MSSKDEQVVALLSHGGVLVFRTNSIRLVRFLEGDPYIRHHIPNVRFVGKDRFASEFESVRTTSSFQIDFFESDLLPEAQYDPVKRQLSVKGMLDRDYQEIMFAFHALQFFSYMYQKQGKFAIHAGAVGTEDGAILILGGEEAGKSTISALLTLDYGMRFLCDERAVISANKERAIWLGGNNVLRLRELESAGISPKKLLSKFTDVSKLSLVEHKTSFDVSRKVEGPLPIKHIFFLRLTSRNKSLREHHFESAIYSLYAALSEDIHGVWAPIPRAQFAMPSIDTSELCQKRLDFVLSLVNSGVGLWKCHGNAEDLCKMIFSITNSHG